MSVGLGSNGGQQVPTLEVPILFEILYARNFVCIYIYISEVGLILGLFHGAEVSSVEWDFINMTEQEEDLIYRMYRLVGDR